MTSPSGNPALLLDLRRAEAVFRLAEMCQHMSFPNARIRIDGDAVRLMIDVTEKETTHG